MIIKLQQEGLNHFHRQSPRSLTLTALDQMNCTLQSGSGSSSGPLILKMFQTKCKFQSEIRSVQSTNVALTRGGGSARETSGNNPLRHHMMSFWVCQSNINGCEKRCNYRLYHSCLCSQKSDLSTQTTFFPLQLRPELWLSSVMAVMSSFTPSVLHFHLCHRSKIPFFGILCFITHLLKEIKPVLHTLFSSNNSSSFVFLVRFALLW